MADDHEAAHLDFDADEDFENFDGDSQPTPESAGEDPDRIRPETEDDSTDSTDSTDEGAEGEGTEGDSTDSDGAGGEDAGGEGSDGSDGSGANIVYSPEMLFSYATYLEENVLPLCEYGADRAAGIGDVRTGYFDHGFQVRQFCVDIENISAKNFESFRRGVRILIEGCRIVAQRYTNANAETDDMVLDLQRYFSDSYEYFKDGTSIADHEPEPGVDGPYRGEPSSGDSGDGPPPAPEMPEDTPDVEYGGR